MPTPPIHHPPNPAGATTRERGVIHRLHRAATTIRDHDRRPAMDEALALLVELIEARNRRQDRTEQWDHAQAEA